MHHSETRDPIVREPEGVVLSLPVLGDTLRRAGVRAGRDSLVKRFMAGAPRVAIVSGSPDHPAHVFDTESSAAAARGIWKRGGLPFSTVMPAICDGIAQGHQGMRYSLILRNLTTATLCSMVEGHGYHAALVLDSCDKRPPANIAALCQVDLQRQRDGRDPFYAAFIPSPVMREIRPAPALADELRTGLRSAPEADLAELQDLLKRPLKCNTYAMWKKFLDRCVDEGSLGAGKRDGFLGRIAEKTCVAGGICAFYGTGNTGRMMLAALGLVPRGLELLTGPPSDAEIDGAVDALMKLVKKNDPGRSVSAIVRVNLSNAARIWAATGGSTNWVLHFGSVAHAVGEKLTPAELGRISARTPHIMHLDPTRGLSMFSLARESEQGGGIERIFSRVASETTLDASAPTVDGTWKQRTRGIHAIKSGVIAPPGDPWRSQSGIVHIKGTVFDSAVVKLTGMTDCQITQFDNKSYLVVSYLGEEKALAELFHGKPVLHRLRGAVTLKAMTDLIRINGGQEFLKGAAGKTKRGLWNLCRSRNLLRVMVVIAGEGPAADGMPEMYYPSEYIARDPVLAPMTGLLTDGRYSGATYGPCIGHVVPEAYRGGRIGALRTGDLVYLDLGAGKLDLISGVRNGRPVRMTKKDLARRKVSRDRRKTLNENRTAIVPSVRPLLDIVTTATEGVRFDERK
jgi:dihydroxyacid dehydratase/phosphogluconate dehydratase